MLTQTLAGGAKAQAHFKAAEEEVLIAPMETAAEVMGAHSEVIIRKGSWDDIQHLWHGGSLRRFEQLRLPTR